MTTPVPPAAKSPTPKAVQAAPPRQFAFLLLDRFTMLAFAAALEPLRLANRGAGRALYSWTVLSADGAAVTCSNGTQVSVNGAMGDLPPEAVVIVCGGLDVQRALTPAIIAWLRKRARHGNVMGGICTGAYALAKAGLLDDRRATIHWENHSGMTEDFPTIQLSRSVFAIDGPRLTSAGGMAALDMMLTILAQDHGSALANSVADQVIYSSIRTNRDTQRLSIPARIGVRHPKLARVIEIMESHIEDPISPADLAEQVDMSTRQLERLFRRYLSRSPKRYYTELRLERARHLLMQTDMSVINVALATGFTSPSHFSKCYRAYYDTTPYRERGTAAGG